MDLPQNARRAMLVLQYNGKDVTQDISKSLTDFQYNDASSGQLDDISISLEDAGRNWQGPWVPNEGDLIHATIRTMNWDGPNEIKKLPLGTFEVDSIELSGPPDTVAIKAVSLPITSEVRMQRSSRNWEKTNLKTVAAQIAKRAKLELIYEAQDNPSYDHLEQTQQSDLGFLLETATREGIAIKVSGGNLVLFDEFVFEKRAPIATITRGTDNVTGFGFSVNTAYSAYRACTVTYTPPKAKKPVQATFVPEGAPKTGPVLKVTEQVDDEAAALRLARKRLRESNKEGGKGSLSLMGDIRMATGLTINIKGWKRFDGKYIIESARHVIGSSGYTTELEIRKVLGW